RVQLEKRPNPRSNSISFSNATSVPGRRHTATFGSPTAAKPRVIEWLNCVVTSWAPTFAGRDATWSRLSSHIDRSSLLWEGRDGCPSRRSVSNPGGNLVSILSFGIDKKILRDLLSCGWRRLMFPHGRGEDIPLPRLKNQKTTELLRRTSMKFRPLHDRVVIKRIEAEAK